MKDAGTYIYFTLLFDSVIKLVSKKKPVKKGKKMVKKKSAKKR